MNKLTAEVARRDIGHLKSFQSDPKVGLSMKEEKYLQALEIALPVLEQQERKPDVNLKDGFAALRKLTEESGGYNFAALRAEQDSEECHWNYDEADCLWSSDCGEDWQFTDGGPEDNRVKFCQGCGRPVNIAQPTTDTYRQIENDGREE